MTNRLLLLLNRMLEDGTICDDEAWQRHRYYSHLYAQGELEELKKVLDQEHPEDNPDRVSTSRRVAPAETDAQGRARTLHKRHQTTDPALCSYGDGMRQLRQCLQKRRGLEKCAPFTDCSRFFANLSHARIMSALFRRGPIERAHPAHQANAKSLHSIVERGFSICDLDRECHEGSYKRWLPTR